MTGLKSLYSSMEDADIVADTTDESLQAAEAEVIAESEAVSETVNDSDKVDVVTTGLEELVVSLEALIDSGKATYADIRIADVAYRGLSAHLMDTPDSVSASMESLDESEIADLPLNRVVSMEALDNVKARLSAATGVAKEVAKKAWAKILELLSRIINFFGIAEKRRKTLVAKVNGLKDSDRKEGEFKVPAAVALQVNGDASFASIIKGVDNLHAIGRALAETTRVVVKGFVADKTSEELENLFYKFKLANSDKVTSGSIGISTTIGKYSPESRRSEELQKAVKNDVWLKAPSVNELKQLLDGAKSVSVGDDLKNLYKELQSIADNSNASKTINVKNIASLNQWTAHAARTSSNLLKVVSAGVKAYGVTVSTDDTLPSLAAPSA